VTYEEVKDAFKEQETNKDLIEGEPSAF